MGISQEQIQELKKQVLEQINSTFPPEKKDSAIEQINAMNQEQFIEFLNQNKLIQTKSNPESQIQEKNPVSENIGYSEQQETPFRQIIQNKIPSYKLDENKESIAVLEINPISPGHCIIIPKNPIHEPSKIPQSCFSLAKKLSRKIKTKFKPKEVIIASSNVLGETILNIVPQYENETLESPRIPAKKEDLQKLQKVLEKKSKPKSKTGTKKIKKEDSKSKEIIPKRIP
jgi:histidine triad (HIT) family protein